MKPFDSLFRPGNVKFFLVLGSARTVRAAAREAGISVQHTARLLKVWRNAGWVERKPLLRGKYAYTENGWKVRDKVASLEKLYG